MAGAGKRMEGLKVTMAMMTIHALSAAAGIFSKLATQDGMDLSILLAYRFAFATAFLAPFAFIIERNKRPKLTRTILGQTFLSSVFGGLLSQLLYLKGLVLTSVTVASAMFNLVPAITFVLAVLFRIEKLAIQTPAGQAKVVGTLVGIAGAMVITFYKGAEINLWTTNINVDSHVNAAAQPTIAPTTNLDKNMLGGLLCLASAVVFSGWFIIQAMISKNYPCFYSSSALMNFMATIQCAVFALIFDHRLHDWKLGWDIRLLSVSYIGIVTGMGYAISAWCVNLRGPLFVSIFGPLTLVVTAILGSLILDEKLHVGSVIGGIIIVGGLYLVLWGKMKEAKTTDESIM